MKLSSKPHALVASLVLAACSPVSSFRPASGLMPGRSLEMGAGATVITPREYVIEDEENVGMVWASADASRVMNITGLLAFDEEAAAGGAAVRMTYLRAERFAGAFEVEGGFAWFGMSLPIAVRLFDQTHLYGAPRLGTWGDDAIFGATGGLSVRVVDGFLLRGEWQRSWQDFKYYDRRDHYGVAVAYQH